MDEGYIKFNQQWTNAPLDNSCLWQPIEKVRASLYQQALIGVYPNGVGYGNISQRRNAQEFLITGSATGGESRLSAQHFALVTDFDFKTNSVTSIGETPASSESLTHAALYQLDDGIIGVIHVHHASLWSSLKDQVPTTPDSVAYGTVEMAQAVQQLWLSSDLKKSKILVMAGHPEGIFTFGASLSEALTTLQHHYDMLLGS